MARPLLAIAALALAAPALGQTAAADGEAWSFSATAFGYFVPDDDDFVLPIVTADRGSLHLEARYNYEAQDSGSIWAGYTVGGGTALEWEVTPIFGIVFGEARGLAPGYEGSLTWRSLELYSEGEYVFDSRGAEDSFFYNWSELTYAPAEWFRFGVAAQRTRVYQTEHDIQRGLIVGFTYKWLDLAGYLFNPDDSKPVVLVSARVTF